MQISELTDREQKYLKVVTNEFLGKLYARHKRSEKIASFRNQIEAEVPEGELQCS